MKEERTYIDLLQVIHAEQISVSHNGNIDTPEATLTLKLFQKK